MSELKVTGERVNAFRLERHGLWPRVGSLARAIEGCGFLPSRESAYLGLAARVEGFCRADLDHEVFTEGNFVELATSRGYSLVLPRALAPAFLKSPVAEERRLAEESLAKAQVAGLNREVLFDAVEDVLGDEGLPIGDLRERLRKTGGQTGFLFAKPGVLPAALSLLRQAGRVARTDLTGPLDAGPQVFVRTSVLFPDLEVETLDAGEALRILCAWYFRVHGPATRADFGWFCGADREHAAQAFEFHRPNLTTLRIDEFPYPLYMPPAGVKDMIEFESRMPDPVALVPFGDPWLTSHEGRTGRFGRREAIEKLGVGPSFPAILVGGEVKGLFSIEAETGTVDLEWFGQPPDNILERARTMAMHLGTFVKDEMPDLTPLTLPGPQGDVVVYRLGR